MTRLFISDTHLHESRPEVTEGFFRFLEEHASGAEALYILGDFFDSWIGDDDDSPLVQEVTARVRAVADAGTHLYIMHGNRDFLIGPKFVDAIDAELLPDPTIINLYGRSALLMHGDTLCTRDEAYMAFRRQVRSTQWQSEVLSKPLEERRHMALQLRKQSASMNSNKAQDIMDVTPEEVTRVMRRDKTPLLIHGHTHRPARHPINLGQASAERIVLGDWHDRGWCLRAEPEGLRLESWPL